MRRELTERKGHWKQAAKPGTQIKLKERTDDNRTGRPSFRSATPDGMENATRTKGPISGTTGPVAILYYTMLYYTIL
jgi:hypothetical protein